MVKESVLYKKVQRFTAALVCDPKGIVPQLSDLLTPQLGPCVSGEALRPLPRGLLLAPVPPHNAFFLEPVSGSPLSAKREETQPHLTGMRTCDLTAVAGRKGQGQVHAEMHCAQREHALLLQGPGAACLMASSLRRRPHLCQRDGTRAKPRGRTEQYAPCVRQAHGYGTDAPGPVHLPVCLTFVLLCPERFDRFPRCGDDTSAASLPLTHAHALALALQTATVR